MATLPTIGAKGLYTLRAPFDTMLLNGVLYEPVEIRSLDAIIAAGLDPYTEYYEPKELTKEQYQADYEKGTYIISFRADSGNWAHVPSTYIDGSPDIGGVPYRSMLLVAYLAPVPDSLDLTFLQNRMKDLVFDTLGVQAEIRPVIASPSSIISQTEHDALESARAAVIANNKTDYAKYLQAKAELDAARAKIAILEQYIVDNAPPVTP